MNNEFYIGWMAKAPATQSKFLRLIAVLLLVFCVVCGALTGVQQKKFSTASFEFGMLTSITGIYQKEPVPSIKVSSRLDPWGTSTYITIPLVGYGKFGAEGVIEKWEKNRTISLENRKVTVRGTLLYSDGKSLLQVDEHDNNMLEVDSTVLKTSNFSFKELGMVTLSGELIDPKCFFGVMKPGHGKPHLDCAVRCVEGGMSPVFYVRNEQGISNYYLVLDKDGNKMNSLFKDYIARPIRLTARAVQVDDWVVLYTDAVTIKPISGLSLFKSDDRVVSCRP